MAGTDTEPEQTPRPAQDPPRRPYEGARPTMGGSGRHPQLAPTRPITLRTLAGPSGPHAVTTCPLLDRLPNQSEACGLSRDHPQLPRATGCRWSPWSQIPNAGTRPRDFGFRNHRFQLVQPHRTGCCSRRGTSPGDDEQCGVGGTRDRPAPRSSRDGLGEAVSPRASASSQ